MMMNRNRKERKRSKSKHAYYSYHYYYYNYTFYPIKSLHAACWLKLLRLIIIGSDCII